MDQHGSGWVSRVGWTSWRGVEPWGGGPSRGGWGAQMAAMQLVTPRLVAMAVRMAMAVWMINFQVSFLFADMIGDVFLNR